MRNKDAVEVAQVIGRELRTCDSSTETLGLTTALAAVAGHMRYVYGGQFDQDAYLAAATDAAGYRVRWEGMT